MLRNILCWRQISPSLVLKAAACFASQVLPSMVCPPLCFPASM